MNDGEKKSLEAWRYVKGIEVTERYPKLVYTLWTTVQMLSNCGAVYFPWDSNQEHRYILNPLKFTVGRCDTEELYPSDFIELSILTDTLSIRGIWNQYSPKFTEKFCRAWFYSEKHDSRMNRLLIFVPIV